jgi:hypothetical protein
MKIRVLQATTGCRHVSSHSLHPLINFEAQTDKPPPTWFWGPNQETVVVILWAKSLNRSCWFWGQNWETQASDFEAKPGETIDLGFEAKPRNPRSSSPCAWCRPHIASSDLSIVWPSNTRPVLDHPRSSAPSLLLLSRLSSLSTMLHLSPTHHKTSKHISPHETCSRVEPWKFSGFKFKPRQVNYSSQIKPRTTWFLNLPLDEYIDNTKAQSLNFESKTTWSTTRRPKAKKRA